MKLTIKERLEALERIKSPERPYVTELYRMPNGEEKEIPCGSEPPEGAKWLDVVVRVPGGKNK